MTRLRYKVILHYKDTQSIFKINLILEIMLKYGYFLENLFNKLHCDSKKIKPELKINNINWLIKLINVRPLKRFYPIINRVQIERVIYTPAL